MRPRHFLLFAFLLAIFTRPASGQAPAAPTDLPELVRLAVELRPKVKAARLMVAQREEQFALADRLTRTLGHLRRDLPVRRDQAALGLQIARAELEAQEASVRYAVSRMYLSVMYAHSARRLAVQAADRVKQYRAALGAIKVPLPALDPFVAEVTVTPALQAENRVIEAEKGEAVALAALRQAIGLDAGMLLLAPKGPLPRPTPAIPSAEETVRLVQTRSPEGRRVRLMEQVHALEVEAQGRIVLTLTADTFAASGDIHSTAVPPEGGDEYRPAPIVPEMPVRLQGPKSTRVKSAGLFAAKAAEVARGVEKLLELRAVVVWETVREKRRKLEAAELRYGDRVKRAEEALAKPPGEGRAALLQEGILALAGAADLETARLEYLVALLELERITLGAFDPGIEAALAAKP